MDDQQLLRYARHILLPQLGFEGQTAIARSSALILGLGGLGCAAAVYLLSSGVRKLILVDDDKVESSNLQRQILHTEASLGQCKVHSASVALQARNAACEIVALPARADAALLQQYLPQVDVALDCSDNFATRQLLNLHCVAARVPLVSGAAIQMVAQVAAYDARADSCPCYACVFPANHQPNEARCADMGVFAPLVGVVGSMQAGLALQILAAPALESAGSATRLGAGDAAPLGRLWQIDMQTWSFDTLKMQRDPRCEVCGTNAGI